MTLMLVAYQIFVICCVHGSEVNVAFNKTASTKSEIYSIWYPSGAVDGDHTKLDGPSSCFHANSIPADWTVDLGQKYQLYHITVYLRTKWSVRTTHSITYLDNKSSRVCYTFPPTISDNPTSLTCNGTARFVTIRNPGTRGLYYGSLNICEVEIYACTNGSYGKACNLTCHCSYCDRWTGICTGDCEAGWRGIRCDIACNGTYGFNCSHSCDDRHCSNNQSSCNAVNGSCDSECLPGWTGTDCIEECPKYTYGENCTNKCSGRRCAGTSRCHHEIGLCDDGCSPGWIRIDCTEKCPSFLYGKKCTKNCTERHCTGNSTCHHETGLCEDGCSSGFEGMDCTNVAEQGTALIAGASAAGIAVLVLFIVLIILFMRYKRRNRKENTSNPSTKNNEMNHFCFTEDTDVIVNVGCKEESETPNSRKTKRSTEPVVVIQLQKTHVKEGEKEEEEMVEDDKADVFDNSYYNLKDVQANHIISAVELAERVKESEERARIAEQEFKELKNDFLYPYDESQKPGNKKKNRFKGYFPYNHNRVVLRETSDCGHGDYINASYMDGYKTEKRFIAAQGPYKTELLEDFWRMIWQEETKVVVMVTDLVEGGKVKCLRYWPETGSESYGNITVTMETSNKLANFTITNLVVHHGRKSKKRHLNHFHYTNWPDHDVPDISDLLTFNRRVNKSVGQEKHPIVVHCSAGIGRTGTFVAVDSLVNQAKTEGVVDVVSFVNKMREQRRNMVQTKEQYLFIYQAVAEAVSIGDTSLDANVIKLTDVEDIGTLTMGNMTVDQHLEILGQSGGNMRHDNVIRLSSYRHRAGFFLVTSPPDKEELWNHIYNIGARTLITWSGTDEGYLPSSESGIVTPVLTITLGKSNVLSDDIRLHSLQCTEKNECETVVQNYEVTGTINDTSCMIMVDSLLQWTRQPDCETSLVVSDSVSESRLLVLLVNIASRLQDDGKVDVISDMRRIREQVGGPPFCQTDVKQCLQFAKRCLESGETYANL